MLLSIIGELRVGTSPRPVMATRLIVPEEQLARGRLERRTALVCSYDHCGDHDGRPASRLTERGPN